LLQILFIELMKGFGKLFLNPLFYWSLILLLLTSYRRIKKERRYFGSKIFPFFSEIRETWVVSVIFSIIISSISIVFGFVFTVEMIILLAVISIVLSITGSLSMLSASYTIGLTYILLLVLPFVPLGDLSEYISILPVKTHSFTILAIITAIFLLAEVILISKNKHKPTYPTLKQSQRGIWIGEHNLKKLAFIPFFTFIPSDIISGIAPIWPYFEYEQQSYSLIFIPFLLGFHYRFQGELPSKIIRKIAQSSLVLSLIVMLFALASLYYPVLSFIAILIAILGKEYVTYRHKLKDRQKSPFFTPLNRGVKVLAIKPNGPAERLGISVGETILKVNGQAIEDANQFYEALQNSGAFFKLDVLDVYGEVRFVTSAFFEQDHYELGITFPEKPFREIS